MIKPKHITFTGVDSLDLLPKMLQLSNKYPIEWGILFSKANMGKKNRYPTLDMIDGMIDDRLNLSAHLCGRYARDVMDEDYNIVNGIRYLLKDFSRIQVNHTKPTCTALNEFSLNFGKQVIGQARGKFPYFSTDHVVWLFDESGGRGVEKARFPDPKTPTDFVGYAGGLGPDNLPDFPAENYWIDMESGVRSSDDHFDINKCEYVCKHYYD